MLLANKKQRALEQEQMRASVAEDMSARMDVGIRLNPTLAKVLGGGAADGGETSSASAASPVASPSKGRSPLAARSLGSAQRRNSD